MLNYSRDPSKLRQILKLIATISNEISKQSEKNKYKKDRKNPIQHYLDKHDGVPLWVLVKYLTLGNIQNFYECMDGVTQNIIAKEFAVSYRRSYKKTIHFTSEMLIDILKTATLFRNVCAHEERLYNFKLDKPSKSSNIANILNIPTNQLSSGNVFTMVSFLKLVLTKEDYAIFIKNLKKLFDKYTNKFPSTNLNNILISMGFNVGWQQLLI